MKEKKKNDFFFFYVDKVKTDGIKEFRLDFQFIYITIEFRMWNMCGTKRKDMYICVLNCLVNLNDRNEWLWTEYEYIKYFHMRKCTFLFVSRSDYAWRQPFIGDKEEKKIKKIIFTMEMLNNGAIFMGTSFIHFFFFFVFHSLSA